MEANVPGADAQRMARQGVPVKVDRPGTKVVGS